MSHSAAGRHLPAEWLSAYLDGELEGGKTARVETHVEACEDCRERLAGMRSVVASLRGLEHMAPAPTINQWVAHRISLEGERTGLMEKIEDNLSVFTRQSVSLFYFSVVIALAAILWLFAWGLERHQSSRLPVVFHDIPQLRTGEVLSQDTLVLAGRTLVWTGRQWVEQGITQEGAANILWGSPEADELAATNIELTDLYDLAQPVMVIVDGQTLRIRHPPAADQG